MNEFIEAFKNTSYYERLISEPNVIKIFIGGSWAVGITDDRSDYDLTIITSDGEYVDASVYEYLMYKGKKVHWYYNPIKCLFDFDHDNMIRYFSLLPLYYHGKDCVIYENLQYSNEIQKLNQNVDTLATVGLFHFFNHEKKYIEDILENGEILEKHHSKRLYNLCLASYFLTKEQFDTEFLTSIKRIRWQPVPEEYKKLAVERLRKLKKCVESPDTLVNINQERSIDEILNG